MGGIRVDGNCFVFYTGKGLREIFGSDANPETARELKKKTEEELIATDYIMKLEIDKIDKVLF